MKRFHKAYDVFFDAKRLFKNIDQHEKIILPKARFKK